MILLVPAVPILAGYLYETFVNSNPATRIVLRTLPILPLALWVIFVDATRPLQEASFPLKAAGRMVLLAGSMTFAFVVLGLGLNWLFEPKRW